MKRAVIVHCWGGNPEYAWYPWLKAALEKQGYEVRVPAMPDTDEPKLSGWLPCLSEAIGAPDEELVLVGHSLGTVTIMRYLEELLDDKTIGKAIFAAGFTDDLGYAELGNFFPVPLDFDKIKHKTAQGFVAIQSDDDPYVAAKYGTQLQEKLGAKLVIKHAAGHMSGAVDGEASCLELPEVLAAI